MRCAIHHRGANKASQHAAGDATLAAKRIFISVGARPSIPEILDWGGIAYRTSRSILDLDIIPRDCRGAPAFRYRSRQTRTTYGGGATAPGATDPMSQSRNNAILGESAVASGATM